MLYSPDRRICRSTSHMTKPCNTSLKFIFSTMLVLNCFPAENRSIWWNVAILSISLVLQMAITHRFTSLSLRVPAQTTRGCEMGQRSNKTRPHSEMVYNIPRRSFNGSTFTIENGAKIILEGQMVQGNSSVTSNPKRIPTTHEVN